MEERIIDDEYARGIRLKKTENGYVDVTDEIAETGAEKGETAENEQTKTAEEQAAAETNAALDDAEDETAEEVLIEFPEEDDEELAALSFEEAEELKKKREEERKKREETAQKFCEEGEKYLENDAFVKAAEAFDKALAELPAYERAAIGYWRAKTENGKTLTPLLDEWAGEEYEQFTTMYSEECAQKMREEFGEKMAAEKSAKEAEIAPLKEDFEAQTQKRRTLLKERTYRARRKFIPLLSVEIALVAFCIVFAMNIFTRADSVFVWLAVLCGAAFVVVLPFFCKATSTLAHNTSLSKANESKSSTEEGRKLMQLEDEAEFLEEFLKG